MATVVPQFRNPWVQNLPNYLQNAALTKMAQRFRAGEGQKDRDFRAEQSAEQRRFRAGESLKNREFNVSQAGIDRDFRAAQSKLNRNFQLGIIKDRRQYDAELLKNQRIYETKKSELARSFQLQTSSMLPIDQQDLPAGMPNIYDPVTNKFYVKKPAKGEKPNTLRGAKFYWENRGGQWYQTKVPAPEKAGITINTGDTGDVGDPISATGSTEPRVDFEAAAKQGTGVWANVAAALDAAGGGLGIDSLLGKEGFFKDTQDARQNIRLLKQLGKSALMNSARGPIWEQKMIQQLFPGESAFFTSPSTEARKIPKLRATLKAERDFKVRSLKLTTDKILARQLRQSITDIDRIRTMLGPETSGLSTSDSDLIKKHLGGSLAASH
jgi:hypothetical protein